MEDLVPISFKGFKNAGEYRTSFPNKFLLAFTYTQEYKDKHKTFSEHTVLFLEMYVGPEIPASHQLMRLDVPAFKQKCELIQPENV